MTDEFWRITVEEEKRFIATAEKRLALLKGQVQKYEESVRHHKEKLAEAEKFLRSGGV